MDPIHHRMPVLLEPADFPAWLDPEHDDRDRLESLMVPCPDQELVTEPIDTWVNRPANEGPDCLRPARDLGVPPPRSTRLRSLRRVRRRSQPRRHRRGPGIQD